MSILQNSNAISAPAGGADFYDHQIANSCRFIGSANDDGTNYMYHTRGTPTNADKCTISAWVKRSKLGSKNLMFTGAGSGSAYSWYGFNTANEFWHLQSGDQPRLESNALFRDTSAWYHIVIANDSTQGTAANRNKIYINGVQYTDWGDYEDYSTQNSDIAVNTSGVKLFVGSGGASASNSFYPFDGYIAEYVFIDGTQYAASDFGETKNGAWIPKDPSGLTFGNNGAYLKFESSSALGNDSSGNNNDFTVTGVAAHDQMGDSPTFNSDSNGGNMCTWNPLDSRNVATPTEGNLSVDYDGSLYNQIRGTMSIGNSGKWYMELYKSGTYATYPAWGICDQSQILTSSKNVPGYYAVSMIGVSWDFNSEAVFKSFTYADSYGAETNLGSTASTYTSTAQIVGMAIDLDNNKIFTHVNGSWDSACGNPSSGGGGFDASGLSGVDNLVPVLFPNSYNSPTYNLVGGFGADSTFGGLTAAGSGTDTNGYGSFKYAVPTNYKAICQGNISAAGADPAEGKQPENNYFQALTYTGTGANGRSLTTKLKPASWWSKNRTTGASSATRWFNVTGNNFGTGTELYNAFDFANYGYSDSTYQGVSNPQDTSITIGNVGTINASSSSYVGWILGVAGAGAVTDTSGDIDSVRFTDADAGISIMDYTGSGTNGHTVPHGLGVKPSFVILKNSTITGNTESWRVWADAFGDYNDYGVIDTTAAWQTSGGPFTADPTATMLPLASGATQNASNQTYQAWVFANSEGMIKAGTYTGNGNTNGDGKFVFTGFEVAFLLIKKTTSNNWRVQDSARDPFNPVYHSLLPNSNAPEDAYTDGTDYNDFLSNGFKLARGGDTANWNASGSTYIYLAFSKMPFKYSTAR